jgi:hypothetical protein
MKKGPDINSGQGRNPAMQTMTFDEPVMQPWTAESLHETDEGKTTELVELMLKDQKRLDSLIRDESRAPDLIPRLVAIALVGFTIFGIAATLILNLGGSIPSWVPRANWYDGTWANLTLAYVLGLVAATGVCLPSFYFYGLLAGVKLSMVQSVAHSVKCLAITAVVLVGALPIYVAVSLGMIVFSAEPELMRMTITLGLLLPFVAGLWGVKTLFLGFKDLGDTMAPSRKAERARFLRRLTVAWAACYTAVTPVMIIWLWTRLSG